MIIGIASDHGGFSLKEELIQALRKETFIVTDFGNTIFDPEDDYPDFIISLAKAIAENRIERGIAICGSGIGASIAANKVRGVRAGLIHDPFSANQGVEDDDMNILCLGSQLTDFSSALNLINIFLTARFGNSPRHLRRLNKISTLEGYSKRKEKKAPSITHSQVDEQYTGAFPRFSGAISAVTGGPPEDINEMPVCLEPDKESSIYDGTHLEERKSS